MVYWTIFWIVVAVLGVIFVAKNEVTHHQRSRISRAILDYRFDVASEFNWTLPYGPEYKVSWDDKESYERTLFRFWDWGCTRILPPEKYEIIKPYL